MTACEKDNKLSDSSKFSSIPVQTSIAPGFIDQVSGIADSKINQGYLWIVEDSGNPPEIKLLKYDGMVLKKICLKNAVNRDWEDLALSSGPNNSLSYLYIADIGDNDAQHNNYLIYRFAEPLAGIDTVYTWEEISFTYADGAHDAETILVDHQTKDIYIITKRDATSKIYKLAYPQSTSSDNPLQYVASFSFSGVVGAAISNNGNEILVKTYTDLFYWNREEGKTIENTLQEKSIKIEYLQEPQGEAVCFKNDGSGFFTLSEKGSAPAVTLNFYKRL